MIKNELEFNGEYRKCESCGRIISICQNMCRECSFKIYGDILTPKEKEMSSWSKIKNKSLVEENEEI